MAEKMSPPHPKGTVVADFDRTMDVLYLALGTPVPAETEEGEDGLLYRFSLDNDEPCGVTVLRMKMWRTNVGNLVESVGGFLDVPKEQVLEAIKTSHALDSLSLEGAPFS